MSTGTPFNPYQPPQEFGQSAEDFDGPRRRPSGLTAVCVISIIVGALGVLGALQTLGAAAFQGAMQKSFSMPSQPGMSKDFAKVQKAQEEMQREIQAVSHKYLPFTCTAAVVNMAISVCLLVGGIMLMKMNPKVRTFMIAVFAVGIVYVMINSVIVVFVQLDMGAVMARVMPQMMVAAGPKGEPGAEQGAAFMATAAKIGIYIGIAITLAWALFNLIFYAVGARYLSRPNIRRLFEQRPANDQM